MARFRVMGDFYSLARSAFLWETPPWLWLASLTWVPPKSRPACSIMGVFSDMARAGIMGDFYGMARLPSVGHLNRMARFYLMGGFILVARLHPMGDLGSLAQSHPTSA